MTDTPHLTLVSDEKKPRRKGSRAPKRQPDTDASAELKRKLGRAYRDQESEICDLLTMANIANDLEDTGERIFAVDHLRGMIDEFKQNWYDRLKRASGDTDGDDDEDDAA